MSCLFWQIGYWVIAYPIRLRFHALSGKPQSNRKKGRGYTDARVGGQVDVELRQSVGTRQLSAVACIQRPRDHCDNPVWLRVPHPFRPGELLTQYHASQVPTYIWGW